MLTLPFMMREPIDLPPIVSVELIEIKDKTYIPFAPKARKIIEKVKEEKKRVVSEQAPPASKAKEKPDRIPMPEDKEEIKELIKKKQNPEEIKPKIRQASDISESSIKNAGKTVRSILSSSSKSKIVEPIRTNKKHYSNINPLNGFSSEEKTKLLKSIEIGRAHV